MALTDYHDRQKFKEDFFEQVLYGTGKKTYHLTKVFKERFPDVWDAIQNLKKRDYRDLSRKMQRAESRVMIDGVCFRLAEEYPEIPVITIHDSIMTTQPHVATVKRLIHEEFAKIGLSPTLKEESYAPAQSPTQAIQIAHGCNQSQPDPSGAGGKQGY